MAGKQPGFLFKQTRVNLDWSEKKSPVTVEVVLPPHPGHGRKSLSLWKKDKGAFPLDFEEEFKLSQFAQDASIYYRPAPRFPRCILWRVLDDWQTLSISSVDFTRSEAHTDFNRTYLFRFPEAINEHGSVGFADAPDHDELVVYVLTTGKVLYTLRLTPDLFSKSSRELQPADFCTTFKPVSLNSNTPHLLRSVNDRSLVVALQDGSLMKLTRQGQSGGQAHYIERRFSDASVMGYFKTKLLWTGNTKVPYNKTTVNHTTAISALIHEFSPRGYNDMDVDDSTKETLLFTVSVDHTLKVWSYKDENLLFQSDLLNEQQPSSSKVRTWLHPAPSRRLAIIDRSFNDSHLFYLVSHSSQTTDKFKFWAAKRTSSGGFDTLEDLYPENVFEVTPPDELNWHMSEFRVTPVSGGSATMFDLWVLWKSNKTFRIQNLQFDFGNVPQHWNNWTSTISNPSYELPQRLPNSQTSEDCTDLWMDWIFYPGRFPDPVLKSALMAYEINFTTQRPSEPTSDNLQARVARVVASVVEIDKTNRGLPDYDKYRNDLNAQWGRFARFCMEMDNGREEALSLVTDPVEGFVWSVNVDGITALRECTETEMIQYNFDGHHANIGMLSQRNPRSLGAGLQDDALKDVLLLVAAAEELKASLSESTYEKCALRLSDEVIKEELFSVDQLMAAFYDSCLFEEVPEDSFDEIENIFREITNPEVAFQSIMDSLYHSGAGSGSSERRLTAFGANVLVTGSQEVININHNLLLHIILLLIHVTYCDEENPFHNLEQPDHIYHRLLKCYREYEVMKWMARNSVSLTFNSSDDDISKALTNLNVSSDALPIKEDKHGSVLQLVLRPSIGRTSGPGRSSSVALSLAIRQFLAGLELMERGNGITTVVSKLLRVGAAIPASDFSRFIPASGWGTYMKARVELLNKSWSTAATYFHKAAYGMAGGNRNQVADVGIFSNEDELQNATGGGLARYYLHVASEFDRAGASEYVVEFCQAALQQPQLDKDLRMEILLKQFKSALRISLFDVAYTALTRFPNKTFQKASVRELVTAMVEHKEGSRLCQYPFFGLQDEVDEALEFKCHQILDVKSAPPFHQVLYAWRVEHGDYRGAASIMYERLQRLQTANIGSTDPDSRVVTDAYLALINVLSCVGEDQRYILATRRADKGPSALDGGSVKRVRLEAGGQSSSQRREILTLADLKAGYKAEVDRIGLLLNGGFFV